MKIVYDRAFYDKLKAVDVRIRKSVKEKMLIFSKNPGDPILNNHILKREYEEYRSVDITAEWRAAYEEVDTGQEEKEAYFFLLGTHKQLYKPSKSTKE